MAARNIVCADFMTRIIVLLFYPLLRLKFAASKQRKRRHSVLRLPSKFKSMRLELIIQHHVLCYGIGEIKTYKILFVRIELTAIAVIVQHCPLF